MTSQKKPHVKLSIGQTQIEPPDSVPGLAFTKSAATGEVRPDAMSPDGKFALGIGDVSIGDALQTMSVGAPAQYNPAQQGAQSIPFSQFYAITRGNPELAEKLAPGITKPDGYKRLQPGDDGQVHVPIAPEAQQTAQQLLSNPAVRTKAQEAASRSHIDAIFAESAPRRNAASIANKGGVSDQQWVDTQTLARNLGLQDEKQLTKPMLESIYPGIGKTNGLWPWVRPDKDRPDRDLMINPLWKGFHKYRDGLRSQDLAPDTGAQSSDGDI